MEASIYFLSQGKKNLSDLYYFAKSKTTKTVMQKIDIIFKIICPILAFQLAGSDTKLGYF